MNVVFSYIKLYFVRKTGGYPDDNFKNKKQKRIQFAIGAPHRASPLSKSWIRPSSPAICATDNVPSVCHIMHCSIQLKSSCLISV